MCMAPSWSTTWMVIHQQPGCTSGSVSNAKLSHPKQWTSHGRIVNYTLPINVASGQPFRIDIPARATLVRCYLCYFPRCMPLSRSRGQWHLSFRPSTPPRRVTHAPKCCGLPLCFPLHFTPSLAAITASSYQNPGVPLRCIVPAVVSGIKVSEKPLTRPRPFHPHAP